MDRPPLTPLGLIPPRQRANSNAWSVAPSAVRGWRMPPRGGCAASRSDCGRSPRLRWSSSVSQSPKGPRTVGEKKSTQLFPADGISPEAGDFVFFPKKADIRIFVVIFCFFFRFHVCGFFSAFVFVVFFSSWLFLFLLVHFFRPSGLKSPVFLTGFSGRQGFLCRKF